jgi:hypothetical protein
MNGLTQTPFEQGFSSYVRSNRLDDLLRDSIDEVLADLLGRQVREAVYDYLERNCSFHREDISAHLPKFLELLEETFGKASKTIGRTIARRLFQKFGWEFQDNPNLELFDYLDAAKARIMKEPTERKISSSP